MDIKCDKYFVNYLRSLPDQQLSDYYQDLEWTPFPILVIEEYKRRFLTKKKDNVKLKLKIQKHLEKIKRYELRRLDSLKESETSKILANRIKIARKRGYEIGSNVSKKGTRMTKRIGEQTSKSIASSVKAAKNIAPSSKKNLELIEMLAKLKDANIINAKEFNSKKKALLKKI